MRGCRCRSALRYWFCCVEGVKRAMFLGCVFGFAGYPCFFVSRELICKVWHIAESFWRVVRGIGDSVKGNLQRFCHPSFCRAPASLF